MKWLKHSQLEGCQCPLGLLPHFYTCRNFLYNIPAKMRVNALSGCYLISTAEMRYLSYYKEYPCQCPLGLLPHFYAYRKRGEETMGYSVNALSGCYLISTVPLQKPRFYAVSRACFCRYLSEYSDNSCFSCMLTIWTHFMRYTYP